jgi:hypothetical protein
MSDMKRAARALQETRLERFESGHPQAESRARLAAALERARVVNAKGFTPHWKQEEGRTVLDAEFRPPAWVAGVLRASSIVLLALVVGSAYAIFSLPGGAVRFLLPLVTLLAILAFPLVTFALNAQREAVESRIRRAIRVALLDADERFPPPQRWADED